MRHPIESTLTLWRHGKCLVKSIHMEMLSYVRARLSGWQATAREGSTTKTTASRPYVYLPTYVMYKYVKLQVMSKTSPPLNEKQAKWIKRSHYSHLSPWHQTGAPLWSNASQRCPAGPVYSSIPCSSSHSWGYENTSPTVGDSTKLLVWHSVSNCNIRQ